MANVKIELGILSETGETLWPVAFRTWAKREEVKTALTHLLKLAKEETIAGIRTTLEVGAYE